MPEPANRALKVVALKYFFFSISWQMIGNIQPLKWLHLFALKYFLNIVAND
jgi:hypothetical protein